MTPASSALLRLVEIDKWAGDPPDRTDILKAVSLTIEPGEFVAIMGASGSGKSTLLNLMGLLDSPSSGTLWLLGREVSGLTDDQLAAFRARSIGFIFQNFNLMPYLTVQENIELGMLYGGTQNRLERSLALLKAVGLSHRAHAYPLTLSGGERQRVAIARALVNRPALLLADEPTGALDSQTGEQILALIRELQGTGTTVVIVTHDPNVARQARRQLTMRDGRLI